MQGHFDSQQAQPASAAVHVEARRAGSSATILAPTPTRAVFITVDRAEAMMSLVACATVAIIAGYLLGIVRGSLGAGARRPLRAEIEFGLMLALVGSMMLAVVLGALALGV